MFKVGDRVRRTGDSFGGVVTGCEYEVVWVDEHTGLRVPNSTWLYDSSFFELVKQGASTRARRALPTDSEQRKTYPMYQGLLAYFPAALANVSHHSFVGNDKHNPGLPLQHARGKSGDHEDCIIRHLVDAREQDRTTELTAAAWRILALLQEHLESEGAPPAPAATFNHKDA